MKSAIIFYFFFLLHSLGMSKSCGSKYNPNNFTSVTQMEGDGWVFSDPTYAMSTWEGCTSCKFYRPGTSYCGYVPGLNYQAVGSCELTLSLVLNLNGWTAGSLTIDYGSVSSSKKVGLYLNGVLVDETCQRSKSFHMDFNDGDELMVVEWGVLLLHSIEFTCSGEVEPTESSASESSASDSSASDSSASDSSASDSSTSDSYSSGSNSLDEENDSSALLNSSDDSIVPITLLISVASIVSLATCFLCMQLTYKAISKLNWQVGVDRVGPEDKVEIQVEGFPDEPTKKQHQTTSQTGEPSEEDRNYV